MSLRRGLFLFLLLSISVSGYIVYRGIDGGALALLSNIKWQRALWVIPAMIGGWLCDAGRFCFVAKSMGYHISIMRGLTLTWLHYFGCAVTPLQVGGGPFQVYVLYKNDNVPVGSGIAITLIRTLLTTFILSIAAPSVIFLAPELLEQQGFARWIFVYVLLLSIAMWCLFIFSVRCPQGINRFVGGVALRMKRLKSLKKLPVLSIYRRVGREMLGYSQRVKAMMQPGRRKHFLIAFLLSLGYISCVFSVLPILIWSLGLPVSLKSAFSAQAMFMFTLYFIPTPGASGVAEGGGAAIFSLLVPASISGVLAIAWRLVTEHVAIFIGAIVALKMIGWGNAQELIGGSDDKKP